MDGLPFGFRHHPFADTADPDVFYRSSVHESACAELFTAIKTHAGVLVLSGEPGTGKTTVLRRVARDVERVGGRVLWCSDAAPLYEMTVSLGEQPDAPTPGARRAALLAALQVRVRLGGATVVAVDEAQRLDPAELGALCDLAQVGPAGPVSGVPLAVLLVGQPELDVKLARLGGEAAGRAFDLRVALSQLDASEVGGYVAYRLDQAGRRLGDVFDGEAIERVVAYAEGIPRVINQLCDAALRAANDAGFATVSAPVVDTSARRLDLLPADRVAVGGAPRAGPEGVRPAVTRPATPARGRAPAWSAGVGVGALVLVAALLYALREESPPPPPPPPTQVLAPTQITTPGRAPAPPEPSAPPVAQPTPPVAPAPAPAERQESIERPPPRRPLASAVGRVRAPSRIVPEAPPPVAGTLSRTSRALLDAAESGSLTEARALLTAGASVDTRDGTGMTPLMVAVIHGHWEVAGLLLARGADPDARDGSGVTALMLAANNDRVALLQPLFARGANVNARTRAGWTALTYAAWKGHAAVARRLLVAGADPALTDRIGWTALQYATWRAADVTRAGTPDAADPSTKDDPESVAAAHLRYVELIGLLGKVTSQRSR